MSQQDDVFGFPTVKSSGGIEIEPGRYLVKLLRYERVDDGQFGPRRKWIFAIATADTQQPLYDAEGNLVEFAEWTSLKLGQKARARMLFEGLLGRELEDGEDGRAIAKECIGRKGLALIGPNENQWTCVLSLQPYTNGDGKAKQSAAAGAAPKNALDPFAE